jgi:uncharacterized protein
MARRSRVVVWLLLHPWLAAGIYVAAEACLPVHLQPTAWVLRASIRVYQATLSPVLPSQCKFTPTCSAYGLGCIRKYGTLRGSLLTAWRLVRCSPLTHGGFDPVP